MFDETTAQWQLANLAKLAKQLSRLGWVGFWIQLTLIIVPVLLFIYLVFFASPDTVPRRGIDLGSYLSYGGLMVMVFTTFWFYRYTRLADRIPDPAFEESGDEHPVDRPVAQLPGYPAPVILVRNTG